MLSSPSLSSALAAAAASLALRRASGAAAGVCHGLEMASSLAGSLPAASAALGGPLIKSLRSRPISSSSTSSGNNHPSPPPLPPSARADFAYCADLVRKSDPENFLWAMELPKSQRAVALALRAYNVETATAADAASAHSRKEGVPKMTMSSSSFSADDHQAALASPRLHLLLLETAGAVLLRQTTPWRGPWPPSPPRAPSRRARSLRASPASPRPGPTTRQLVGGIPQPR